MIHIDRFWWFFSFLSRDMRSWWVIMEGRFDGPVGAHFNCSKWTFFTLGDSVHDSNRMGIECNLCKSGSSGGEICPRRQQRRSVTSPIARPRSWKFWRQVWLQSSFLSCLFVTGASGWLPIMRHVFLELGHDQTLIFWRFRVAHCHEIWECAQRVCLEILFYPLIGHFSPLIHHVLI